MKAAVTLGHRLQVTSGIQADEWQSEGCSNVAASRFTVPTVSQSQGQGSVPLSPGHDIAGGVWPATVKYERHTTHSYKHSDHEECDTLNVPSSPVYRRAKLRDPPLGTLSSGEIPECCESDTEPERDEVRGATLAPFLLHAHTTLQQVCVRLFWLWRGP
jgi:hypothetical protein